MSVCDLRSAGILLAAVVLAAPLSAAEEAWRADGRRQPGALTLHDGQLHFTPTGGEAAPITDTTRIRFTDATPPPFRIGDGRSVCLRDGQRITGQILELDEEKLVVHPAWAARVEVPRGLVASIEPLAGWRTVAADDFRHGLKQFEAAGDPMVTGADDGAGERSVVLRQDGQKLTYLLGQSLTAGRVGVNFREQGRPAGGRWTYELRFQEGERSRRLVITLAGEGDTYAVDAGGLKGEARDVPRASGWHRLVVQFSARSLRVLCDDEVLWYGLDGGPGGPLERVTMRCQSTEDGTEVRGAVAWAEFCLERAVVEHRRPLADPGQDELRLAEDDQLFGHILGADRRDVRIEGRFGKRSLPWTAVAGCSFRRPAAPPKTSNGGTVRLLLGSGLGPQADVLDGTVTALDERRLTLRHALFGEVTLERSRLRELRPLVSAPK